MKPKPFSMLPAIASRTYFHINNYAGALLDVEDAATHVSQLEIWKPLHVPTNGTYKQNGLGLSGSTDLTIGLDVDKRTVTPIGGIPALSCSNQWGILFYKGEHVPAADIFSFNVSTGLFTLTAAKTTSKYTSTSPDDYLAYYADYIPAILTNVDIPNISMPVESSGYGGIGCEENVYSTFQRGASADATGSITFQMSQTAWGTTAAVAQNAAGAEILRRIYGTDFKFDAGWDSRNRLINVASKKADGCYITILQHSGLRLDAAQGQVWGVETTVPSLIITDVSAPNGISNDSSDPITMTIEFAVRFPELISQNTIWTTG